jgi:hypothetical protein
MAKIKNRKECDKDLGFINREARKLGLSTKYSQYEYISVRKRGIANLRIGFEGVYDGYYLLFRYMVSSGKSMVKHDLRTEMPCKENSYGDMIYPAQRDRFVVYQKMLQEVASAKPVTVTSVKPYEFSAVSKSKNGEYLSPRAIAWASADIVAMKPDGFIAKKELLTDPNSNLDPWYYIKFEAVCWNEYDILVLKTSRMLFNGDDKFYPVTNNHVSKEFGSPYIKPKMLTTEDQKILQELVGRLGEKNG